MLRRRAVKRFFWTLFVVIAQVAVLPNALAFEESRTEYGARLRLTFLPVRVRLDSPVPGFSDGGRSALVRAMATWNAQACSFPLLVMTEEEDDVLIEVVPILDHWKFGSVIAAHTMVDSDSFRGDIRHVVIEIDARRTWSQENTVPPDAIDLESVFLHELGHALGLDHSRNQEAVMRAGIKPGQTRRILHDDDARGICAKTKLTVFGENNSASNVALTLWYSKWLIVMMIFFVVGIGAIVITLSREAKKRQSTCGLH
jgi:Matrixin